MSTLRRHQAWIGPILLAFLAVAIAACVPGGQTGGSGGPVPSATPHPPLTPASPTDPFSLLSWAFTPIFQAMFILLVFVEMVVARLRDRRRYCPKDTLTSLGLGFGSSIAGVLSGGLIFALAVWVHRFSLVEIPYAWWAFVLCFVLDDLAYYVFHRTAHRVRWFWASHVIHHSSQHYNLSTALRQTWTGFLTLGFAFALPLVLIGFHPVMIAICGGFNLIYQFWIHTEAIGKMPRWFEAVMNTPSHHRVHHATNPRYLDRNYAGVFIVWDKMFGTFEPETDE